MQKFSSIAVLMVYIWFKTTFAHCSRMHGISHRKFQNSVFVWKVICIFYDFKIPFNLLVKNVWCMSKIRTAILLYFFLVLIACTFLNTKKTHQWRWNLRNKGKKLWLCHLFHSIIMNSKPWRQDLFCDTVMQNQI